MRRRSAPLLLTPLLALWIGACDSKEEAPPAEEPAMILIRPPKPIKARLLALGDSYTIGERVPAAERFPAHLVTELRKAGVADFPDPAVFARTGWTVEELLAAMDSEKDLFEPSYDLVTVLIGVNNQYRGRSVDDFRPAVKTLLKRAAALASNRPGRVIVVSIPDWGVMPFAAGRDRAGIAAGIDAFNAACRDAAAAEGMTFIDITPLSRQATADSTLVAIDGLHPSGAQYAQWAKAIAPAAAKALR